MFGRLAAYAILLLLPFLFLCAPASAGHRLAFVVGIDDYSASAGRLNSLKRAAADANAMDGRLQANGFQTLSLTEGVTLIRFQSAWEKFLNEIDARLSDKTTPTSPGRSVALFFFAGHGIEANGENFLLPADLQFDVDNKAILRKGGISISGLIGQFGDLQQKHPDLVVVMVLDACRDNPLLKGARDDNSGEVGNLTPLRPPSSMFVFYSTGIGQMALDGEGENSVYTTEFLKLLDAPDNGEPKSLGELAQSVRFEVFREASSDKYMNAGIRHMQTPAYYDQLVEKLTLLGGRAHAIERATPIDPGKDFAPIPRDLRRGDAFMECRQCPELVVIDAGGYTRGSKDGPATEQPASTVLIERMFAIGKFEVTNREWNACVVAKGCPASTLATGPDLFPVTDVTWDDANAYVTWLSAINTKQTGSEVVYRLPSEAEWEYAARGGSDTAYSFGDGASEEAGKTLCDYANGADASIGSIVFVSTCNDGTGRRPAQVGSYKPNGFGLHDVHGNVWEWTQDCWSDTYQNAPSDGAAYRGDDATCDRRAARGGSWRSAPSQLRTAARRAFNASDTRPTLGFRVVRVLGK